MDSTSSFHAVLNIDEQAVFAELTRVATRNPPGSDRPSDARKPMWINGGCVIALPALVSATC